MLTVLAGVSRFVALDRPAIWVDEASTYRRVSGTYEQMLHTLERDPFGPLFYEIQWLVRQIHPLTPFWLRLVPAIAGTLMIPAMYFLARQLAGIRTSLATAMLTLCSAWLINYSRDAKMYMTFWLFVALSAGCFLWWLRTRTWIAWLTWIAASCAMIGVNSWGAVIILLSPIWMLTARRVHWAMGVGLVVGVLIIATGPVGYYQVFNHWRDKVENNGRMPDISWAADRNRGAGGLDLAQDSAAAFFYNFTFIQEAASNPEPPQPVLVKSTIAFTSIIALLALGAFPWRRADALPPPTAPEPWWRPTLWLGLWIIVPTYVFYCMSVDHPQSPVNWREGLLGIVGYHWLIFTALIIAVAGLVSWQRLAGRLLITLLIVTAAITLLMARRAVYGVDVVAPADQWHRPIDTISRWLTNLVDSYWLCSAVVILPAVAIARSARTYRGRLLYLLIGVLILVGAGFAMQQIFELCANVTAQMRASGVKPTSIWVPRYLGFIWPALAIAVAALLMRLPTSPLRWAAVLAVCALNLYVAAHRVFDYTEPRLDLIVADIYAGAKPNSPVQTYVQDVQRGSGPGGGGISNMIGRYYLLFGRDDLRQSPDFFMYWQPGNDPKINWLPGVGRILGTVRSSPEVNEIITWRAFVRSDKDPNDLDLPAPPEEDVLLDRLGPGWQRTANELMPVRYHWCWAELYLYRRRVYKKLPTTQPTTQPAKSTQPTAN